METLKLENENGSLIVYNDASNGLAGVKGSGNSADQTARLELDQEALSIALLNSSDLGLTVDNDGLTTIFAAEIQTVFLKSENGSRFRLVVGNDGTLSTVPA
jgi:hypothetical protein